MDDERKLMNGRGSFGAVAENKVKFRAHVNEHLQENWRLKVCVEGSVGSPLCDNGV
jgi:hypothetical protein